MDKNELKSNVLSGLFWKYMENSGIQGVQFILQLILARLLMPRDYGIIALVSVFLNLANTLVQSSFNKAIIQKKDINDTEVSSVFFLSIASSGILYGILFFSAPAIADFYNEPVLTPIFRVLSITLFLGAFNSIQNALISKQMKFKILFKRSLGAIIVSGIVGVILAYKGFGVWALVYQQLLNQLLLVIFMMFIIKWRPKLVFSMKSSKDLFSFGWKMFLTSLFDNLFMNLRSLIIGKKFSGEALGYYNRGKQFPFLVVKNLNGSIQSVLFPAMASQQDNYAKIKSMVRRSIVTSSFLVFPTLIGLGVIAKPLVTFILTEKWLPCVLFLQIHCIMYMFWPMNAANIQAINAIGRSDIYLKLEIVRKVMDLIILFVSLQYGVYAIAIGGALSSMLSNLIYTYPNYKLLNYSYFEQIKDIMPSLILSIVMGAAVYSILIFHLPDWLTLIIQFFVGGIIYFGLAKLFKLECFQYLINTFQTLKNQRGKKVEVNPIDSCVG